jgi:hypothetical protein
MLVSMELVNNGRPQENLRYKIDLENVSPEDSERRCVPFDRLRESGGIPLPQYPIGRHEEIQEHQC